MPVPYYLTGFNSNSESNPDLILGDFHSDGGGVKSQPVREPTGNGNEVPGGEQDDDFKCGNCQVKLLSAEYLHYYLLDCDADDNSRKHLYCSKCRVDHENEAEAERQVWQSSNYVVCGECSKEFPNPEELEFHLKQFHQQNEGAAAAYPCPACGILFDGVPAADWHLESEQCRGDLMAAVFKPRTGFEGSAGAKRDLSGDSPADETITHTRPASIIPSRVKTARAKTPEGPKPGGRLAWKDFSSALKNTLPAKPAGGRIGSHENSWGVARGVYFCPRVRCGKKFAHPADLRSHLESGAHDRKTLPCPICFRRFASPCALLQHAESVSCRVKRSSFYEEIVRNATGGLANGGKKAEFENDW